MTTSAELAREAPPLHRVSWPKRLRRLAIVAGLVALYGYAWHNTEVNLTELVTGFHNLVRIVGEMVPPDWSVFDESVRAAIVTFNTALLGTTFAFVISLILAPLAARNLTPHRLVYE